MREILDHPFQPGQRVAVQGAKRGYTEDVVAKAFKTGNFTLESKPGQQWRPWPNNPTASFAPDRFWHATATGARGFSRTSRLVIWNDETDEFVRKGIEEDQREERWRAVERVMYRLRYDRVTDEALQHFEAAIAALAPPKGTS